MKVTIGIWKIAVLWAILTAGAFAALAQTTMTTPKPAGDARMPTVADQKVDIAKTSATGQTQSPSNRTETTSEEESAILPYYNNYLREYHLGPEDTISVEVFGQPNYSKSGIVIPPNSKISYPLIPGGVFVGGKTVDQVADDIKKKLNEYIIDPQVTVTLDKAGSARFSVLGLVAAPGVKVMNRRYNLFEAIAEAGGIQKEGDKKRILLIRIRLLAAIRPAFDAYVRGTEVRFTAACWMVTSG